jgi:hypothetical protein
MQKSLFYGLFIVALMSGYAHGMQFVKDTVSGAPVGIYTSFATMYALGYTKGVVEKIPAVANVFPYAKWISLAAVAVSGMFESQWLSKELSESAEAKPIGGREYWFTVAQRVVCKALPSFLVGVGGIALCNKLAAK